MAHGALGTLFTVILLNCIEEGNFSSSRHLTSNASSEMAFGFQRVKVRSCSSCVPVASEQYPL